MAAPVVQDNCSPTERLRLWLSSMSDPLRHPWPEGGADRSPIAGDAVIADPTSGFGQDSDVEEEELSNRDSSDVSSSESEYEEEEEEEEAFKYRGRRDDDGLYYGGGVLTFTNGDVVMADFDRGVRSGDGVVISPRNGISRLCGTYSDGKLQGRGQLVMRTPFFSHVVNTLNNYCLSQIGSDTSVLDCFFKDSVVHGLCRKIDMKKFREFRRQLSFVGRYLDGRPAGNCWTYVEGGGFIFGDVENGEATTGEDFAYVYPDQETAFVGSFVRGRMLRGAASKITDCTMVDGIMV